MSDLAATNCGCGNEGNGCCSWIVILILLFTCGGCGNGNGLFGSFGNNGCGDNGCSSIIWILILLCACGNGF